MLRIARRRIACGNLSSSVRNCSAVAKETCYQRTCCHVRNFSHQIYRASGSPVYKKPARELLGSFAKDSPYRIWTRSLSSSDNGDLFDAVVPFMGESITDGTLATFLKKPGDRVEIDEPIAQVETDKVTIDVASPEAGVIEKFVAKEGDTVMPGTKVAVISKAHCQSCWEQELGLTCASI